MRFGPWFGRFLFYRTRGREYLELFRGWVVPVSALAATIKYLGFTGKTAFVVAGLAVVVIELTGVVMGWLDVHSGAARTQYTHANALDPFKERVMEELAAMRRWLTGH